MSSSTAEKIQVPVGTWNIDPVHTEIAFGVRHLGVSTFRGRFSGYEGTVTTDESGLTAIEGTIDISSIDVSDKQLGGHLLSADFFDAENHPAAVYRATDFEATGEGTYRAKGEFTLRGVTQPLELDVVVEGSGEGPAGPVLALSASGALDRTAYGIDWDSRLANGVATVGEKVRLMLTAEFRKAE